MPWLLLAEVFDDLRPIDAETGQAVRGVKHRFMVWFRIHPCSYRRLCCVHVGIFGKILAIRRTRYANIIDVFIAVLAVVWTDVTKIVIFYFIIGFPLRRLIQSWIVD